MALKVLLQLSDLVEVRHERGARAEERRGVRRGLLREGGPRDRQHRAQAGEQDRGAGGDAMLTVRFVGATP